MIPAQISLDIDEKIMKDYIMNKIDEHLSEYFFLIDLEKLMKITCMKSRYLEEFILNDPRVKQYERRKSRKRYWLYKPTMEAIEQIINEWE